MRDGAAPLQIEDEHEHEDEDDFLWPSSAKKSTAPTPLQRLVLLSAASSESPGAPHSLALGEGLGDGSTLGSSGKCLW